MAIIGGFEDAHDVWPKEGQACACGIKAYAL